MMIFHINKQKLSAILREAIDETLDTSYRGYLHGEIKNRVHDWDYDIWDDDAQAENLKKLGKKLHRDMSDFDIANGGKDTSLSSEMKKLGFIPLNYANMDGSSYDGEVEYYLIDMKKIPQVKDKFQSILNFFNYKCINMSYYDGQDFGYDMNGVRVALEPIFTEEITDTKSRVFYHATPDRNVKKILRQGLVPKDRGQLGKQRPERIYLTPNFDPYIIKELENENGMDYTVLKVDLSSQPQIKLYKDPYYSENGLYTVSYIPPSCISVLNPQPHKLQKQRALEIDKWLEELSTSLGLDYSNGRIEGQSNNMEINLNVGIYPSYNSYYMTLKGYVKKLGANGKTRKTNFDYDNHVTFKSVDGYGGTNQFAYEEVKPLLIDKYLKAILTKGTKRYIW